MTIWEISEKADYIHSGIVAYRTSGTSTAIRWFRDHVIESAPASRHELRAGQRICFVLFEHFRIYVTLADGFNATPSSITSKQKMVKTNSGLRGATEH